MKPSDKKLDRFIELLKSIFELDKVDLDFGIYRIINLRRDEIVHFLSDGLPKKVQAALAPFAADTEIANLETDVYSALYNFFNRYYDEGDFISNAVIKRVSMPFLMRVKR